MCGSDQQRLVIESCQKAPSKIFVQTNVDAKLLSEAKNQNQNFGFGRNFQNQNLSRAYDAGGAIAWGPTRGG